MNTEPKPEKKSTKQQIVERLKNSQNILIVSHVNPDGDSLGSSLGLWQTLKKLGKNVSAAASGHRNPHHNYLPQLDQIKPEISGNREFVITLNTTNTTGPHKVKYKTEDQKIHLIITPDQGQFSPQDLSVTEGQPKFDLIVTLDTPNLEYLDKIYEQNSDIFHQIPIINIDHHPDNQNYGEINYIDTNSSSTCEIIISIIEALSAEQNLMDADIATCILTGILSDTASFQNNNTTPKSLTVSAQMIAAGANHPAIIKNLFKTQPLSQLKIWGKILTKLQIKPSLKLAWSTVSLADLQETGSSYDETSGIIDALIKNLPDINVFMLLVQTDELIKGSLRSNPPININPIAVELGGGGHPLASGFRIYNQTLDEAESFALATIEKHLSSNINDEQSLSTEESIVEPETTTNFPTESDSNPNPEPLSPPTTSTSNEPTNNNPTLTNPPIDQPTNMTDYTNNHPDQPII